MKETGSGSMVFLIIISLWFWHDHSKLNQEISELQDENSSLEDALDQANSNIEEAQSYAWSSYDDMGYVLDNLETVQP